jgi:hypothetical protein
VLNHIRRDLAVLAGLIVLGLFLMGSDARARAQDKKPGELPDLEKLLPPGAIDPDTLKQLKKLLEGQDENIRKMMDDLQKQLQNQLPNFQLPPGFNVVNFEQENRLGADLQKPSRVLIDQLDLPEKQGVVLKSVKNQSPAAKAGLKTSDILLELNGKAVPSDVGAFVKQLNEIKKDTAVDAVVLRKGKRETIKGLKLGEVPAAAPGWQRLGGLQQNMLPLQQNMVPLQLQVQPLGRPGGVSMSQSRGADGSFATKYREGDVAIDIKGKVEDKKASVDSIQIRDGDKTNTYKSLEDVPEDFREDVRALIRSAETGQNIQKGRLTR